MKRAHLTIAGRVQGVGFRYALRSRAASLGVGGWARNRPDGTVEAVLEGPGDAVDSLVAWCGEGPRGAAVSGLNVRWEEPAGEEPGFRVG